MQLLRRRRIFILLYTKNSENANLFHAASLVSYTFFTADNKFYLRN